MLIPLLLVVLSTSPELQPKTYVSPSGLWSLRVEPEERSGTGGASYVMTTGVETAWKAQRPFALWDAVVGDDGSVAGYAYVGKPIDAGSGGELRLVLFSPSGSLLLEERRERTGSRFMHQSANPVALGVFLQPEVGRAVVRLNDEDVNRGAEEWLSYELATGKALASARPKETLRVEEALRSILAVRPVPGTPLVLLHWWRADFTRKPSALGAVFQLVDPDWNVAWSLALPVDYVGKDEDDQDRLREEMWRQGAILASGPRSFELRFAAAGERVTFAVERAGEGWSVTERARAPFTDGTEAPRALPRLALRPARRVALGTRPVGGREVRDIAAFGFDERSRLRFVRREADGSFTLVRLDEGGTVVRATPVAALEGKGGSSWFPLPGGRWFEVRETWDDEPARLRLVQEEDGAARFVPGFSGSDVERIVALEEDAFVLLGTWSTRFTRTSGLVAFDLEGNELWHVEEDYEDETKLFGPKDVAVTTDGHVVVLDNTRNLLQFYSTAGEFERNVELTALLGREPNYVSGLCAERGGGLLVEDFGGVPPLHRLSRELALVASFGVRRADGTVLAEYQGNARSAPDGRLWTTDGHQFLRSDDRGRVDLELGSPEDVRELAEPGFVSIDSTAGRILVCDQRSRAVHVFDGDGKLVTLCRPKPEERDRMRFPMGLAVAPDGHVYVAESEYESAALRFAPDGTSLGLVEMGVGNFVFVPGGSGWIGEREGRVEILDEEGKTRLRLDKRPDGNWFRSIEELAAARDGTLAVLDGPESEGFLVIGPRALVLFNPGGEPKAQLALPEDCLADGICLQGTRVLLWTWSRGAYLLDTRDGSVRALQLPEPSATLGLSPDGSELWLVTEDKRTLLACPLGE